MLQMIIKASGCVTSWTCDMKYRNIKTTKHAHVIRNRLIVDDIIYFFLDRIDTTTTVRFMHCKLSWLMRSLRCLYFCRHLLRIS